MTPQRELRHFDVSDAVLLGAARSYASQYPLYSEKFTSFDSEVFGESFHADFMATIEGAEALPSDNVLIDEQAKEGEDVLKKMAECLDEIRFADYFIKKIATDQPRLREQFGYNDLQKVRNSPDRMIRFMDDFARKAVEYRAVLEAKNYPAVKLDRVIALADELKDERDGHNDAKNNRKRMTDERIRAVNKVWGGMVLLADAVEFAIPDDAVAREIFTLPRHSAPSKPKAE